MSSVPASSRARRLVVAACAALVAGHAVAQPAPVPPVPLAAPRPVAVRVTWGGGQPHAWSGTVALVGASGTAAREPAWRTLCTEPDAAAMVYADGGTLVVRQPRPVGTDGVEIVVPDAAGWRLVAAVGPAGAPATVVDVAVADLLAQETARPLDGDGNRLVVAAAPGELLRATLHTADGTGGTAPCRPGERVGIVVDPFLPTRIDGAAGVELRLRLKGEADGDEVDARTALLVPVPAAPDSDAGGTGGRRPVRFETVRFDVALPAREGAWRVELEAVEGSGLGWTRQVARRSLQLVTVAEERPASDATPWRTVYELDPGSPRLHERLRRLPGVGLPNVSLPHVPLPRLSRPTLPQLPLPNVPLPSVSLPHVPLPQMPPLASMVPRLSGLLASGHSRVEPHPLGPMLLLPAAEAADAPAWEGIVIAGAQPETPHVVEVEFPSDQDATVGVTVLELDRSGGRVEPRYAGGFEVRRADHDEPARIEVHRFVFWPSTRHPVVLLANRSRSGPALVGHVRIRAGPARLAAAAGATGRRVYGFLPDPGFADFGAAGDPATRFVAAARSAELIAAHGAAGAMVVVHAEGAALWPSRATHEAPRWGAGADGAAAQAATPDLLAALCRVYERQGLRLLPALVFDAPLPALEAQLARGGAAAAGIACVGRDGRPWRAGTPPTPRYNVLDPRVQQAVEEVVGEVAARLRGAAAVDGVALVLPHDGWLHLPGTAWGLDDATFARFRAAVGVEEPDGAGDRFAARAALVEGPLRDRWLEWRAAEMARFHGRLADVLAEHDGRWSLSVAPTTLWAEGAIAERLRPTVAAAPAAEASLREAGLDPVRSTAHRRVVFVTPHVHDGDGPGLRGAVAAGNHLAARGTASAARRGVLVLERPWELDVKTVVPHGPFGSAQTSGPCRLRAPVAGAAAGRALAEAFAAADAEVVFDARLALVLPALRAPDRAALEGLPEGALAPVAGMPVPLVVRARRGDTTWVHVVNAAAAPVRAELGLAGSPADVMDTATGAALDMRGGTVTVELPAWGMRALRVGGDVGVTQARLDYDPGIAARVAARVGDLRRRREALESPVPRDVLDNAAFELGAPAADGGRGAGGLPGWELLEARRGAVALVPGNGGAGQALAFSSVTGLSTLRSNPFPSPASGRISVAAWLRIRDGERQPPLRIAIEGVRDEREYYRFAAVGGLAGGRPLAGEWSQFVLQVDDLPEAGLESLRVRFDLLGPGTVEIDDVRVFDLAFTEPERVRLSRQIGAIEAAAEAGEVGACLVALDGHWPRFLEAHVPLPAPPAVAAPVAPQPAERTGTRERSRRWWQ